MKPHGIADDARRVKSAFQILHDDEYERDEEWMSDVAPLRDGDQNGRNPAKNDPDVWNHCENGNKTTDEDGKI